MSRLIDFLRTAPQYVLPQHGLSRLMHRLTRSQRPWLKNFIIARMVSAFKIDASSALEPNPFAYPSFNAFFTRALKPEARPFDADPQVLVSPVDGKISQWGPIEGDQLIQAKGKTYSLRSLLGEHSGWPAQFAEGEFATLYLSPRDYHRIHMPCEGRLLAMMHIPGDLFAVNDHTVRSVNQVLARNERVVALFEHPQIGPFAMVLVGAIFVGSIETVWAGEITPPTRKGITLTQYDDGPILQKGEEMGRFNMGSTVILLFPKGAMKWNESTGAMAVSMGQSLGQLHLTQEKTQ
jgi:phosphatidylserine decarboxylase